MQTNTFEITPAEGFIQIGPRKTIDRIPKVKKVTHIDGPSLFICEDLREFFLVDPSGIRYTDGSETIDEALSRAINHLLTVAA